MKIAILSPVPVSKKDSGKAVGMSNLVSIMSNFGKGAIFSLSNNDNFTKGTYPEYEISDPMKKGYAKYIRAFNVPSLLLTGIWLSTQITSNNKKVVNKLLQFNPDLIIVGNFIFANAVEEYIKSISTEKRKATKVICTFDSYKILESFIARATETNTRFSKVFLHFRKIVIGKYYNYNIKLYEKMLSIADLTAFPTEKDLEDSLKKFPSQKNKLIFASSEFVHKSINKFKLRNSINTILFIGGYDHEPNRIAMRDIENIIAPMLKDKKFIIAGKGCPVEKKGNVEYKGTVSEVEKSRLIRDSDLCIAPLTIGSGIKIKMLDYFSEGKAVIGTAIAFEGYRINDGFNAILENDLHKFADRIRELEKDKMKFERIQNNAQSMVEDFTYEAAVERWRRIIEKVLH
jgi:hypothetical protein